MTQLESEDLERIAQLVRRYPLAPVVLVAPLTDDAVQALLDEPELGRSVVWLHNVGEQLRPHVLGLVSLHFLDRAVLTVSAHLPASTEVLKFLEAAWTVTASPGATVKDVAASAKVEVRGLRREWAAVPVDAHLLDIVHWGVLARALEARESRDNWFAAAFAAGVSERTLERITRKLLGATPGELIAQGFPAGRRLLEQRFREWIEEALSDDTTE